MLTPKRQTFQIVLTSWAQSGSNRSVTGVPLLTCHSKKGPKIDKCAGGEVEVNSW